MFQELRRRLQTAPALQYPDPKLEYILDTDASNEAVGTVLSPVKDGKGGVVAYFTEIFSLQERNYCVTCRELLAVVNSVKHFCPYLYGRSFKSRTDHVSLIWLCNRTEPSKSSCQVVRSFEQVQIHHRASRRSQAPKRQKSQQKTMPSFQTVPTDRRERRRTRYG